MVDDNKPKVHDLNIKPSLPLHDPSLPWLPVIMVTGEKKLVDLKTLFLESHLISKFTLEISVSTASLYRVLISIAYGLLEDTFEDFYAVDWEAFKVNTIKHNLNPFSANKIEEYFDKYSDRFYLVHPTAPFLQDASLYTDLLLTEDKTVKTLYKKAAPISALHPGKAIRNGNKPVWGLPIEDYYSKDLPYSYRVETLLSNLLFQKYSTSATGRSPRQFEGIKNKDSTAYPVTHAFRCAPHYVPQLGTLANTLLLAMPYVETVTDDIPEWEWEQNSLGFPGLNGKDHMPLDRFQTPSSPRSSINSTQLALLYIPELDAELCSMPEGGNIKALRSVTYGHKHAGGTAPQTWNPFVAYKDDGKYKKAYKITYGISKNTMLKNSDLSKMPYIPNKEFLLTDNKTKIILPEVVTETRKSSSELYSVIKDQVIPVTTYVYAGDPSKEKSYTYFETETGGIILEHHILNKANNAIITTWLSSSIRISLELKKQIGASYKEPDQKGSVPEVTSDVDFLYWSFITPLFENIFHQEKVSSIEEYDKEILNEITNIFNLYTKSQKLSSPLRTAKALSTLSKKTYVLLHPNPKDNTHE